MILCRFPSDTADVRSMILDHIAALALRGEGELSFVGTERTAPDAPESEIIAVKFKSVELADAILLQWRNDTIFPDFVEMRVLRIEPIRCVDALVAMFP
jgi:hypothetical protein